MADDMAREEKCSTSEVIDLHEEPHGTPNRLLVDAVVTER